MRRIEGDLIALAKSGQFDVLVHGCNCFHTMGAGIAKIIAKEFPAAAQADMETPKGDRAKLGTISHATVECDGHSLTIVNAYTQFDHSGHGQKVDYNALQSAFEAVAREFPEARIGYPLIGAGLAGGDWDEIAPRIDTALDGMDHALVVLPVADG
ncbi:phosphatase [Roseovarius atlanticus]|uniref:Phosphatase n=1 Tax=Roseovarius atlanticus TaxID=1641875 RepID=A0A0T5NQN9_9RHOB|nr:macro domain-containing protein [Roseovarius atlanticus]KRS11014.1 phosphatase [Roseovarius atlanticus]